MICEHGCWDTEDEMCHAGLDQNGCAEIYGHVEWSPVCNCRWSDGSDINQAGTPAPRVEANIYFSVPAFVVLFRESFEVVIILVICIQFLHKAKEEGTIDEQMFYRLRREVYVGASIGFLICVVFGALCILLASLVYGLFEGDARYWADGLMMTLACLFLTGLAFNFYKLIYTREFHERKLRQRVGEVIEQVRAAAQGEKQEFGKKYAFFFFALMTGLREGLESIIFLISVITDFPAPSYMASLPIPLILAVVLARICGYVFFQGTKRLSIVPFVRSACLGCCSIAAGMFASSCHKWQELGLFGRWTPAEERPWMNQMVWDASDCCNDKTNKFWVLMRALFGWQDKPTPVEFFAFPLYWIVVIPILLVLIKRWRVTVAEKLAKMREEDAAANNAATTAEEEQPDATTKKKVDAPVAAGDDVLVAGQPM
jgi:high-affinity iron transporter